MSAVTPRAVNGKADHFLNAGVTFVKILGDDGGVAIHAQGKLGQVIGANRKAVEMSEKASI